jgi:hypothetical protein
VPAAAAEAARDTLGAALVAAAELPAALGQVVVTVATDAFVQGMQTAALISAVLALGVAGLVVVFLRDAKPPHAEGPVGASDTTTREAAPRPTFTAQPEA